MAFTNNRLDFYNNRTYEELSHAQALAKGIPNFVNKGLELTGTTLSSGIFSNGGTFGQLGNEGETYDITANYTGYVIIKSTLNGSSSTSVIELDTTRKDTDPRDTGNVKYFTIYKLNAGAIEEDYRHSNYIKDISFENVGGSNFVQIINGTKSNPFDASAFSGTRNVLDDKDINYDDTIHALTLVQDIYLDVFTKTQTLIGNDKPGVVSFCVDPNQPTLCENLATKSQELIMEKTTYDMGGQEFVFKLEIFTANGISDYNVPRNRITISNKNFEFIFDFDYDDFSNTTIDIRFGSTAYGPDNRENGITGGVPKAFYWLFPKALKNFRIEIDVKTSGNSFGNNFFPVAITSYDDPDLTIVKQTGPSSLETKLVNASSGNVTNNTMFFNPGGESAYSMNKCNGGGMVIGTAEITCIEGSCTTKINNKEISEAGTIPTEYIGDYTVTSYNSVHSFTWGYSVSIASQATDYDIKFRLYDEFDKPLPVKQINLGLLRNRPQIETPNIEPEVDNTDRIL